jgi:hypothetical protein
MSMSWTALVDGAGGEPAEGEIDAAACPACNCAAHTAVGKGLESTTEGLVACSERLEAGIEFVEGAIISGPTGGEGATALFPLGSPLLAFRGLNLGSHFMLTEQS